MPAARSRLKKSPTKSAAKKSSVKRAPARKSSTGKSAIKKSAAKKTTLSAFSAKKRAVKKAKPAVRPSTSATATIRRPSSAKEVLLRPGEKAWVVEVPFAWRSWASTQGVSWDAHHRVHVFKGSELPASLQHLSASFFSWEWQQECLINGGPLRQIPVVEKPWMPRPHQLDAVLHIERAYRSKSPGFLLADEVGTGKTISSWSFSQKHPEWMRVLVVTTASALAHWRNTLIHTGVGKAIPLVINYDRLGRLFEDPETPLSSTRRKGKRKRLAKEGKAPEYDLVIWDESHKCKNLDSARSVMMRKINAKAQFVLWLSATAGQNPLELAYLAPLLARATGAKPSALLADFEQWCLAQDVGVRRAEFGKWVWERTPEREKKVYDWLFNGNPALGLRRLPTDIVGWPALERQLMPQELDVEAREAYAQAWSEFRQAEMGLPADRRGAAAKEVSLTARLRLRQKSSWLRIPATVALAEELLAAGRQVPISVAFHDTLNEIEARLSRITSVAVIHGKQSPTQKEAERMRFQTGAAKVIVFTVEEAISLHQGEHNDVPRTLLIHDQRWSAIQQAQIEGRAHRDGKFAPSLWLYAPDTVEDRLLEVLVDRVQGMKAMHGDGTSDMEAIDAVLKEALKRYA